MSERKIFQVVVFVTDLGSDAFEGRIRENLEAITRKGGFFSEIKVVRYDEDFEIMEFSEVDFIFIDVLPFYEDDANEFFRTLTPEQRLSVIVNVSERAHYLDAEMMQQPNIVRAGYEDFLSALNLVEKSLVSFRERKLRESQ